MHVIKKLAVATLAVVSLAGAFVVTQFQEVKAESFAILSGKEKGLDVAAAKAALEKTLQERHFRYFDYDNVDLADVYGSPMKAFEEEYRIFGIYLGLVKHPTLNDIGFYDKLNQNILNYNLTKIQTEDEYSKAFEGIYR